MIQSFRYDPNTSKVVPSHIVETVKAPENNTETVKVPENSTLTTEDRAKRALTYNNSFMRKDFEKMWYHSNESNFLLDEVDALATDPSYREVQYASEMDPTPPPKKRKVEKNPKKLPDMPLLDTPKIIPGMEGSPFETTLPYFKEDEPIQIDQDQKPVVQEAFGIDQDQKPLVKEDIGVDQDQKPVVKEAFGIDQDQKPVVKEAIGVVQDQKTVVEETKHSVCVKNELIPIGEIGDPGENTPVSGNDPQDISSDSKTQFHHIHFKENTHVFKGNISI